jgi:hypothetical protein
VDRQADNLCLQDSSLRETEYVGCTTKTLNKLVEHIDDPVKRKKIYLMLYAYEQLFDDSSVKDIICTPQYAINTGSHSALTEHPRQIFYLNHQIKNDEIKKMLDNDMISPSNSPAPFSDCYC